MNYTHIEGIIFYIW